MIYKLKSIGLDIESNRNELMGLMHIRSKSST